MLKQMKPGAKEVSKLRLVFVQGTRKGRLSGMRLIPESEVRSQRAAHSLMDADHSDLANSNSTGAKNSKSKTLPPTPYIINVSGICHTTGSMQRWQLCFASEEDQTYWNNHLSKARDLSQQQNESGEAETLREFGRLMKSDIKLGARIYR